MPLKDVQKKFLILYSSDLHGNIYQFKKLFDRAYKRNANAIIIGGDMTPKDSSLRTPSKQFLFLKKDLLFLIKNFNTKNKSIGRTCDVFLIFGNDDYKSNYKKFKKYEKYGFKVINNQVLNFFSDFKLIGYSYVPVTPFIYKDWEKPDLIGISESTYRKNYIVDGKVSVGFKLKKYRLNLKNRKNSIENDLNRLFNDAGSSKVILLSHAPPYKTFLDMTHTGEHVGSFAVKKIIEKRQPYLTLHGHIHETVDQSGKFMQKTGKTISLCSGNNHIGKKLAILEFDIYAPSKAKRIIL